MTKEEIMELDSEAIEARMTEIEDLVEKNEEGTDFEALSLELDSIKERKSFLAEEQRKADVQAVIEMNDESGKTIEIPQEERKMADVKEIRASKEYMDAFANYIKTGDDAECRALLTELVSGGVVPVPSIVDDYISTAWNENDILQLVSKSYIPGIVRIGFELSATGATVHVEGAAAPDEETLTIGVVELKPVSYKKWISISDEAVDLKGEAFIRYIYDELAHQIAKAVADALINAILAAPSTATATAVAVPSVDADPALGIVSEAMSQLSDRASNPTVIINKKSFGTLKAIAYAANYPVDFFEGLTVKFNDQLTAIGSASTGDAYMIVGDFGVGVRANFPNGEEITTKYDDISLAEKDLVKIVGREYVALGLVASDALCVVKKA